MKTWHEERRSNRTHLSQLWHGACTRDDWWIKYAYNIHHTPKHERNPWQRLNRQAIKRGVW